MRRELGLVQATSLAITDMVGIGPYITIPLLLAAMGGPQAMLAWFVGALIAFCDGLVWAELGAALPKAGGSYNYLREAYGPRSAGRWLSFMMVWQIMFSAPLSVASGSIGFASYLRYLLPGLGAAGERAFAVIFPLLLITLLYRQQILPLGMLLVAVALGLYPLVKIGLLDLVHEHKIGTELFVTVATVIAMVSIVTGFNNNMIRNFQSFGATLVQFQKFEMRFGPGHRPDDIMGPMPM